MIWEKPLRAIRCLRSEHHAHNVEPDIVNVLWVLGKRCNYDCSYCPPTTHDWASPHLPIDAIADGIGQIDDWIRSQNKRFNMHFTGGEPFVHPDIIEIFKIAKQSQFYGDQLTVISNGSLPLELYEKSFEYLSHLTISLHFERPEEEIKKILDKIVSLDKNFPHRWVTAQVMCEPGKFEFIQNTVVPFLEANQIKYSLRRVRPWLNEAVDEWKYTPKIQILKTQYPLEQQTKMRQAEKTNLQLRLTEVFNSEDYYTTQELEWLRANEPTVSYNDVGFWNEDLEYYETNSDFMLSNDRSSFTGWTCFGGVDTLYIDNDGLVYRTSCQNDGSIGVIGQKINFLSDAMICKKQHCLAQPDRTVRKARPDSLHLITKT